MIKKACLFCSFLLVSSTIASIPLAAETGEDARSPATDPAARMKSWEQHVKLKEDSIFKDVKWTAVGPRIQGGKIESIWSPKKHKSTIYAGVGSGNLWKTVNNGTTWKPVFESESTFSISVVTVCDKDPNLVWVGTGEPHMARSSFAGTGVFKSTDGAKTWKHMGLVDTHHIGRVLIDPKDSNVVYVAALGHQYTYNEQRGLFKTTDGGKTWAKSLYISEKVGVVEVAKTVRQAEIASWDDIDRLDVRPGKAMVKVRGKNGWEIQIDTQTGDVLQAAVRRSDLIESIHDGSYFHDSFKLWVFLPAGLILVVLVITGLHLFILPHLAKRRRRRKTLEVSNQCASANSTVS